MTGYVEEKAVNDMETKTPDQSDRLRREEDGN